MLRLDNPGTASRPAPSAVLHDTKAVAVLRAKHASDYAPVIEALQRGGVLSIELTLSTPGVWDELPLLRERFGDSVEIGVGTVTEASEAETALDLARRTSSRRSPTPGSSPSASTAGFPSIRAG